MRIIHVIQTLDPAMGGPVAVCPRLAAAQASHGHEITVVTFETAGRQQDIQTALRHVPGMDQVQTLFLPPPRGRLEAITCRHVRTDLTKLLENCDVLHTHGVWDRLGTAMATLARQRGVAYVIRPAGMLDTWCLQQSKWKKRIAMALQYRQLLNGAAFIHALNADEAKLIPRLKLTCPLEVIPNGVFIEEIEPLPQPGSFYTRHPELEGQPFILFLSRLHYKKGLDLLAPAFEKVARQMSHVHLVVAGPDGGAEQDFDSRIAQAGLTDRVHRVGPIYGSSKYEAMVDAACFCLPSRQEGFSVAITEALACGAAVVITEGCHFPEVGEVGAGEVVALDCDAIGDALIRVLGDRDLRSSMGKAGRQLIESRFLWPIVAEMTMKAYARAAARRS